MPYSVNGQQVAVPDEPQNKDGILWVPLRPLCEALGASVEWSADTGAVNIQYGKRPIQLKPGDIEVVVAREPQELQAAPYVEGGETWVPVRFFNLQMGCALNVDLGSNTVEINST